MSRDKNPLVRMRFPPPIPFPLPRPERDTSRDKNPLVRMRFPPPLPSPKPSPKPSPLPRSIPSPKPSSLHIETVSRPGSKYPFDTDTFDTDLIRRAFPNMTGRERRKFETLVTSSDIPLKPEPRRSSQSKRAQSERAKIEEEEQDALRRRELEAIYKMLDELDGSIAANIERNNTIPYEATSTDEATSTGLLSSIMNRFRRTSKKPSSGKITSSEKAPASKMVSYLSVDPQQKAMTPNGSSKSTLARGKKSRKRRKYC